MSQPVRCFEPIWVYIFPEGRSVRTERRAAKRRATTAQARVRGRVSEKAARRMSANDLNLHDMDLISQRSMIKSRRTLPTWIYSGS